MVWLVRIVVTQVLRLKNHYDIVIWSCEKILSHFFEVSAFPRSLQSWSPCICHCWRWLWLFYVEPGITDSSPNLHFNSDTFLPTVTSSVSWREAKHQRNAFGSKWAVAERALKRALKWTWTGRVDTFSDAATGCRYFSRYNCNQFFLVRSGSSYVFEVTSISSLVTTLMMLDISLQ